MLNGKPMSPAYVKLTPFLNPEALSPYQNGFFQFSIRKLLMWQVKMMTCILMNDGDLQSMKSAYSSSFF